MYWVLIFVGHRYFRSHIYSVLMQSHLFISGKETAAGSGAASFRELAVCGNVKI
jgi:hypothetical protein